MNVPILTTLRPGATQDAMGRLKLLLAASLVLSAPACVQVSAPDKPIEINLNVTIRQEVLVRLQRDVEQLINQNPQAFPQPKKP
jgi:hypothetical protein